MGQTRSMIVEPSPDADADAGLLQEVLPFRRQAPTEDTASFVILLWEEECLVLAPSTAASTVTWVLSSASAVETIQKACQRCLPTRTQPVTDLSTGRGLHFTLPSGSSLIVVTEETVASEQDRLVIARRLPDGVSNNHSGGKDNGSSHSPKRQLRTMGSNGSLSELSLDDSRSSSPRKGKPVPEAPVFDTLSAKSLQSDGTWDKQFPLNAREPYPFETELFKGEIILLVRPPKLEQDPYWSERIFSKKKRRLIFNVQGKFKRPVQGPLYIGGEITSPMNLSLFTRGLLGTLVKLLEGGFSGFQYSFGDEKKKLSPRICVPAFSGMERVVVTPPDESPPPLTGDPFEESKEDRTKRVRAKDWQWNTNDTYSFSFFSMYIDLCTWKIVNLPVSPEINLRRLWNDGDFRLVMYEKRGKEKEHHSSCISYAWNINLRYLGDKRVSKDDGDDNPDEPDDFEDIALDSDYQRDYDSTNGNESESSYHGFHRSESSNLFPAIMEGDSSSDDEEDFFDAYSESMDHAHAHVVSSTLAEAVALLASIDELVPAWIHAASGKGKYERVYAVCQENSTLLLSAHDCEDYLNKHQTSSSIHARIEQHFSPRLSSHEKSRRSLGLFLRENGETAFGDIKKAAAAFHDQFLQRTTRYADKFIPGTILRASAARAVSDRHWEEEWLVLTAKGVLSCYHPEKRKVRIQIQISNILKASALPGQLAPSMQPFCFLCIETFGRSIYFMMESTGTRDQWLRAIWDLQKNMAVEERSVDSDISRRVLNVEQPSEEFLHKSSIWNYKNRRILNCGQYNLKCTDEVENPLDMVKEALQLSIESNSTESVEKRHLFFQSAGALKRAMVQKLSEEGRLAFFLNLYHCMVMHAFLVIGPPGSALKWISFFNNLAYEVGDDLFSISELEHCIIRARMAHPSQFMSRFVIPKSQYRMELQKADFRINFALNPGSLSSPSAVFMYDAEIIDQQLDMAASLYLERAAVAAKGRSDLVVSLPRVCQWFLDDFGSQDELLQKIHRLLKSEDRLSLEKARSAGLNIIVHFDEFNFKCRPFVLKDASLVTKRQNSRRTVGNRYEL